jgi:type VI secretion system protein ImpG
MSDTLFPHYERELLFIRQFAQDFARQYPAAAGRLLLEPNRSLDPHVERLIESFALLTARIQHRLDDDFPELTEALLGTLCPHYLAPVPSMAIVQFELNASQAKLPKGFTIAQHSRLQTPPANNVRCHYRTGYPVTLWPIKVSDAVFQVPPFPPGVRPPPGTAAVLRVQLECLAGMKFKDLSLEQLRFYLCGDNAIVSTLYELLFNHALQVVVRPPQPAPQGSPAPVLLDPRSCLGQVGFDRDQGLLPYPPQSFLGYRLLSEFFSFPNKFQFFDLGGWQQVAQAGYGTQLELAIYFNRAARHLERGVNASTLRLGCTPVINLFEQVAEPISFSRNRHEYRIVPDVAAPQGYEVYSVDSVTSIDPVSLEATEYAPFYQSRHGTAATDASAFWYASRRPCVEVQDRATDVFLVLVDSRFDPAVPTNPTLVVRTTCTNRNLPNQLQQAGERLHLELEAEAPLSNIRCLRTPTSPLRPPSRQGLQWALISHLSLNHLSLTDSAKGRETLQQILQLYDFYDPQAGQTQMSQVTRQMIDGITSVKNRRVIARSGGSATGFCHGMEVTVEFDEQMYAGNNVFLFACVLECFLGLYTSINSFSQMVGKFTQQEGNFKKWPPRTGEQRLL